VLGLRRRGLWIDLVHLRRAHSEPAVVPREGGRDWLVPVAGDAAHALAALWPTLERDNAGWTHVVAFGGALPVAAAPRYAAWLGVPLVVLLRGNDFDTGIYTPERFALLDDAIRRAARVGCVTEGLRRRVQRLYPGSTVCWTPNGIDCKQWQALPSDQRTASQWRAARLADDASGECRLIGMFGHLKAKKGAEMFVKAIERAALEGQVHFVVVGTPPEDFAARLPRDLRASFFSPVARSELIPILLACDAVALPSHYEGFPNMLLEAAALGTPLIASDAGAAGVVDERHGVLFRAGDVEDCAMALSRFVAASEAQRRSWRSCCEHLAQNFSAERECAGYIEIFALAAGAGPARIALVAGARGDS
jgi:glycosyltransferase involved in cell wall biosynthesis